MSLCVLRSSLDGSAGEREHSADVAHQPSQADLTQALIERKAKQEQEAVALAESQRLNLRAGPVWMYRLGLSERERGGQGESDQGENDYEDEDFDPADYVEYEPPTEAFMKRFFPRQYGIERPAAYRAEHPDPDLPPF